MYGFHWDWQSGSGNVEQIIGFNFDGVRHIFLFSFDRFELPRFNFGQLYNVPIVFRQLYNLENLDVPKRFKLIRYYYLFIFQFPTPLFWYLHISSVARSFVRCKPQALNNLNTCKLTINLLKTPCSAGTATHSFGVRWAVLCFASHGEWTFVNWTR